MYERHVVRFDHPERIPVDTLYGFLQHSDYVQSLLKENKFLVELQLEKPADIDRFGKEFEVDLSQCPFRILDFEKREDDIYCTIEETESASLLKDLIAVDKLAFFFRCLWNPETKKFRITKPICFNKAFY